MSSAKLALALALAAISLSACGTTAKPKAGTLKAATTNHQQIDDPRQTHVRCLEQDHVPVLQFSHTWIQVGAKPYGPTVHFEPTSGAAQWLQINGTVQSAEVIGSALLYPNQAPADLLKKVEDCVAMGVKG